MNLDKLKKEIEHQSRNGRDNMYIEISDIIELIKGSTKEVRGKDRIYVNIQAINQLINAYENNKTLEEKEKDEFLKRIHVDMPKHELIPISENGALFHPLREKEDDQR